MKSINNNSLLFGGSEKYLNSEFLMIVILSILIIIVIVLICRKRKQNLRLNQKLRESFLPNINQERDPRDNNMVDVGQGAEMGLEFGARWGDNFVSHYTENYDMIQSGNPLAVTQGVLGLCSSVKSVAITATIETLIPGAQGSLEESINEGIITTGEEISEFYSNNLQDDVNAAVEWVENLGNTIGDGAESAFNDVGCEIGLWGDCNEPAPPHPLDTMGNRFTYFFRNIHLFKFNITQRDIKYKQEDGELMFCIYGYHPYILRNDFTPNRSYEDYEIRNVKPHIDSGRYNSETGGYGHFYDKLHTSGMIDWFKNPNNKNFIFRNDPTRYTASHNEIRNGQPLPRKDYHQYIIDNKVPNSIKGSQAIIPENKVEFVYCFIRESGFNFNGYYLFYQKLISHFYNWYNNNVNSNPSSYEFYSINAGARQPDRSNPSATVGSFMITHGRDSNDPDKINNANVFMNWIRLAHSALHGRHHPHPDGVNFIHDYRPLLQKLMIVVYAEVSARLLSLIDLQLQKIINPNNPETEEDFEFVINGSESISVKKSCALNWYLNNKLQEGRQNYPNYTLDKVKKQFKSRLIAKIIHKYQKYALISKDSPESLRTYGNEKLNSQFNDFFYIPATNPLIQDPNDSSKFIPNKIYGYKYREDLKKYLMFDITSNNEFIDNKLRFIGDKLDIPNLDKNYPIYNRNAHILLESCLTTPTEFNHPTLKPNVEASEGRDIPRNGSSTSNGRERRRFNSSSRGGEALTRNEIYFLEPERNSVGDAAPYDAPFIGAQLRVNTIFRNAKGNHISDPLYNPNPDNPLDNNNYFYKPLITETLKNTERGNLLKNNVYILDYINFLFLGKSAKTEIRGYSMPGLVDILRDVFEEEMEEIIEEYKNSSSLSSEMNNLFNVPAVNRVYNTTLNTNRIFRIDLNSNRIRDISNRNVSPNNLMRYSRIYIRGFDSVVNGTEYTVSSINNDNRSYCFKGLRADWATPGPNDNERTYGWQEVPGTLTIINTENEFSIIYDDINGNRSSISHQLNFEQNCLTQRLNEITITLTPHPNSQLSSQYSNFQIHQGLNNQQNQITGNYSSYLSSLTIEGIKEYLISNIRLSSEQEMPKLLLSDIPAIRF